MRSYLPRFLVKEKYVLLPFPFLSPHQQHGFALTAAAGFLRSPPLNPTPPLSTDPQPSAPHDLAWMATWAVTHTLEAGRTSQAAGREGRVDGGEGSQGRGSRSVQAHGRTGSGEGALS